ncbi:MAG TPA: biopolymer transporter ExbD [Vicinamibacteria bacterium]|nr:biopolymer transporter ExbD [Vicinamibacteria bacterium]
MDMAMRPGGRRAVVSDINVTPMADIMIVLLIIFMVAITQLNTPPVPLPEASHGREAAKEAIALVVTAGGAQIGKDAPMDVETLSTYLAARVQTSRSSIAVLIQADRDVEYAPVARVLQACRAAGIEEVGLATRSRVGEP